MCTTPCVQTWPRLSNLPISDRCCLKTSGCVTTHILLLCNRLPNGGQRQKCTKPPARGRLVWREVTRHAMRSSTFGQVRVPGFSHTVASRHCYRQGAERYGKRLSLKTCSRSPSHVLILNSMLDAKLHHFLWKLERAKDLDSPQNESRFSGQLVSGLPRIQKGWGFTDILPGPQLLHRTTQSPTPRS